MQVEDRKKKGLCFHCEDKWYVGHQCKTPKIFLMEGFQQNNLGSEKKVLDEERTVGYDVSTEL